MTKRLSYIEAIGAGWPTVQARTTTQDGLYSSLSAEGDSTLPTEQELDTWISSRLRSDMWALIQAERDRRKAGGISIDSNWFHTDDTSRIQYIGLVLMGANMPTGIMWKTMSGNFIAMTPTLVSQIFQGIGSKDVAIFTVAEQLKAQMNASSTPETFNYLTPTSPVWPTVFGD